MRTVKACLAATFFLLIPPLTGRAQQICAKQQSPEEVSRRIDALIQKLTIAERISQLGDRSPGIPRIGLPGYNWWNEGLHGVARVGYATVFPQAIGLAATWDPGLLMAVGDTVSTEARSRYNAHRSEGTVRYGGLTVWSPNINIFRDPRWGRGQETYGEDPFLTATLGAQFVKGVQGSDPFYFKAESTHKHFVAHSGPEKGRDSFDARVSQHDLEDTYLPAFHALTTRAEASSIMCSYNAINGTPSCANQDLLVKQVRERWGFSGYVVSDCGAIDDISSEHHYTADAIHGAAAALNAGVDLACGDSYKPLQQAFEQGLVSEATINRSLHRLLLARVRLGMPGILDAAGCTPYDNIDRSDNDTAAHRALSLQAAEESIVLLRNDGTLPLKSSQRVAVIGPTADMLKILEANYHGTASKPVTPLEGIRSIFGDVTYAQGSLLAEGLPVPIERGALHIAAEENSPNGLNAEYFDRASFEGKAVEIKTVAKVDLDVNRNGPSPAITRELWAARWSGFLKLPAAGDYVFRVNVERCWDCTTHDHFRLFIDGKMLVDNDGAKSDPDRATLHFNDTAAHALRLELIHSGKDEGIALEWIPAPGALLAEAEQAASKADTIVAFVGLSPDLEGEALQLSLDGFDGGDRTSLQLPATQSALLERLHKLRKPMVIVLTSGSAVAVDPQQVGAAAMLEAWYPGESGGEAIANVLDGKTSPSGRLPVTFYRSTADLPPFSEYSMADRTYRYHRGPVLFPFGFGLSYAHFEYSPVHLQASTIIAGQPLVATTTVTNTSNTAGAEVAELYLAPPQAEMSPRLALAGTQRVFLKAGESRELSFTLQPEQLSFVDQAGVRAVRSGAYRLSVGGAQPRIDQSSGVPFEIKQNMTLDF